MVKSKNKLINQKSLNDIISKSPICQHAVKELKFAGYGNGEGGPNDWIYQQILEAVAVFASHNNSNNSAPWEISLDRKSGNWDIISPLTFKDDEWIQISEDGSCQNKRKSSIFRDSDGFIYDINAFSNKPISTYRFDTKIWEKNDSDITWHDGLFEYKDNVLTGRYFSICNIWNHEIDKNYMPKSKRVIPCVEVEISPDNWIMAVSADSTELLLLSIDYNIKWKQVSCLKGIRLEDVTLELEKKAYEELKK
mgnify:CR=1 FL=1